MENGGCTIYAHILPPLPPCIPSALAPTLALRRLVKFPWDVGLRIVVDGVTMGGGDREL